MKFLKGKRGDKCPKDDGIELKVYRKYRKDKLAYFVCDCDYCPYHSTIWVSKEGFVTVRCKYE